MQIYVTHELEIEVKARLDRECTEKLGLMMDIRCFLGIIFSNLIIYSVVEGQAGLRLKHLINMQVLPVILMLRRQGNMKRILITGKNSFIGISLKNWLMRESDKYIVETIDMKDESWKGADFSRYDVVFHVAGIAHVSSDPKMEERYYKVNRDLTIEAAGKAKAEGVKQFVFMSSIIVYGDCSSRKRIIDRNTVPTPSNFYGNSKLQAEEGIKDLESDKYKVVILRPPMIYGKGSKGNYPRLANIAKKIPLFPDIDNERSMLHIDNLCEFIKLMIDHEETGLYFPQNTEYVKTSELVRTIAEEHGNKIWMTRIFNPVLRLMFGLRIVNKVFGNLVYEKSMSDYDKANYRISDFRESIRLTELEGEQ